MQVLLLGGLYGTVAGLVGVWEAGPGESGWLECLRFVVGFGLGNAGVFSAVWLGERLFGLRLILPLLGVAVADMIVMRIFLIMLACADTDRTPLGASFGPDWRIRSAAIVLVMGVIAGAAIERSSSDRGYALRGASFPRPRSPLFPVQWTISFNVWSNPVESVPEATL
jgi:hypothetical protein